MTAWTEAANRLAHDAFGAPPVWRFFVPGRIEVFGKHTDYAGGRSLVCAVPRGFTVAALPGANHVVEIMHAGTGERLTCPLDDLPCGSWGWRRYALAAVGRLHVNFPSAPLASRIVFSSDLPHAAGISSSSALVIAIAEALIARAEIEQTSAWQGAIRSGEDRAGYFGCIENGADFGPLAGGSGVGTHGGSEDHAAIVMSRAGELRQLSYDPIRLERVVPMPEGWTFAVAFTGVHAAKGADRQQDYNRLALACRAIVSAWRERHPGDGRTLGQLVRDNARGVLDQLHDAVALTPDLDQRRESREQPDNSVARRFSPALIGRLEHFAGEDARTAEASDAFARGDLSRVGALSAESHDAAARLLGNQVPETHALVALARDLGAAAASAFGGGWGGSVWALVRTTDADPFLARWLSAYRTRFPGRPSIGFISPPSEGVIRG